MAYSFDTSDPSVEAGLRRIAASQFEKLFDELEDDALDLHERVHQVRKRCKKLRGLIRLVRPAFEDYGRENAALRDAARGLSDIRDAGALVEILDALLDMHDEALDADAMGDMTELLAGRRRVIPDQEIRRALDRFASEVEPIAERARGWRLEKTGWKALRGGLVKTHGRMRSAQAAAFDAPSRETIHEWRKRVKYHWYHARLLRRIWSGLIEPHRDAADRLSDLIGDYRDFSLLRLELDEAGAQGGNAGDLAEFIAGLALARQGAMAGEMVRLGELLAAEESDALAARWGAWWSLWQGEGAPADVLGV